MGDPASIVLVYMYAVMYHIMAAVAIVIASVVIIAVCVILVRRHDKKVKEKENKNIISKEKTK